MKKKLLMLLIAFASATAVSKLSAETWIVYTVNGATHVYHTFRDINCDTFVPAPGVTIDACFH